MSGYLWDRSGTPDPKVVDLERQLASLGWRARDWQSSAVAPAPRWSLPFVAALAAIVTVTIGLGMFVARQSTRTPGLDVAVTRLEGTPTIGRAPLEDSQVLTPGRWLETNDQARALVEIENVGRIDVRPGSRMGLLRSRTGAPQLFLSRGTVDAVIISPPGEFSMGTPSATAVDLGCVYTLTVGADAVGLIEVVAGWVGFEWRGREAFIPAGAACVTRPRLGPGTPYYGDTSPAFRAALATIDQGGPDEARRAAVDLVLAEARPRDVLTLWHLLSRVRGEDLDRVFDRLAGFVPPPAGVTLDAVRAGQRDALDAWWDALDLGSTSWWRTWKQQWRER